MFRFLIILTSFLWAASLAAHVRAAQSNGFVDHLDQLSLSELEAELASIDSQLRWLAPHSLRSGIGVIGYRSDWQESSKRLEWVQIELDKEYPIDEIVLVPTLWRNTQEGFQSDGFPRALRIVVGTTDDQQGRVVAQYGVADKIQPRIGPLVVPVPGTTASWVRVEATDLTPRAYDSKPVFQLSEIFVFSNTENVALRQSVSVSSNSNDNVGAWDKQFLVDGHTPYLMDSSEGSQSIAYVSRFGEQPALYLDLGKEYTISRIHLHAVDQGDTVPQAYAGDLGIPRRLRIEGASDEDFTDVKTLLDYQRTNINEMGPIMMWRIPKTTCRFVRLIAVEQDQPDFDSSSLNHRRDIRIGFAEIELFAGENNVALGKRSYADYQLNPGDRSPSALTDGRNLFGKILPIKKWLGEMALRNDMEAIRPRIVDELNRRYTQQRVQLTWLTWLAALLGIGIGVTFVGDRIFRMRQLAALRIRFAADLHDELGANLHVIGLLSDLARAAVDSPQKLQSIHERIRSMTERSGDAVRYCTNMVEAKQLYGDLLEEMRRTTERIMADLEGELSFDGDPAVLRKLKTRIRADLFLFYKECLVNISRHSDATQFSAQLTAKPKELRLIVCDNGHGLTDHRVDGVPSSLARRARLLRAKVSAKHADGGGVCILLTMPTRRYFYQR
ncbi:sensor histidine kinase [Novipirellula aureliae]|nr:histidine kinase [Novipirellula aureliae]